ncbi:MAG: TraR/DksA C4-type zinc finger protein [Kiritimatiellae bacterium]|nr:TraR/DksA C4-type zinc finger protein [Kiritimatiellia bacterium]
MATKRTPAGPSRSAPRPTPPATEPAPATTKLSRSPLSRKDLEMFRQMLLNLRDRIVDGISFLAGDNLNKSQRDASGDLSNHAVHMADQGTDNFDREFALSLVSNEQEILYEIDEALHRIDAGTYGICELTGRPIEIERLKVLPYARYCREAQEQLERNRKRFRPFASSGIPGETFGSQEN